MCDEALKCVTFRLSTTVSCSVLIMFCKQYYFVVFKKVKLKPRLNLPPIIVRFFGLRFSLRFLDIVGDHGLRRMC